MKLLTVKQPWASLICLGIKDVENRTWSMESLIGERILIMSSKKDVDLAQTNEKWAKEYLRLVSNGKVPCLKDLPKGKIIGYVDISSIEKHSDSLWAADETHLKYVLKNPHIFKTPLEGVHGQPRPINYEMSREELEKIAVVK